MHRSFHPHALGAASLTYEEEAAGLQTVGIQSWTGGVGERRPTEGDLSADARSDQPDRTQRPSALGRNVLEDDVAIRM